MVSLERGGRNISKYLYAHYVNDPYKSLMTGKCNRQGRTNLLAAYQPPLFCGTETGESCECRESALVAVATSCVSVVFYHECHQETVYLEIRISTFPEEVEIKFRGKMHDKINRSLKYCQDLCDVL